jgi:hypothetical protein
MIATMQKPSEPSSTRVRGLPTGAPARVERSIEGCEKIGLGSTNRGGAGALISGRRKVNTQHAGPLCSKSYKVIRPFDERDAVLLPLINDPGAQRIAP